jgi:hypothetical protein
MVVVIVEIERGKGRGSQESTEEIDRKRENG